MSKRRTSDYLEVQKKLYAINCSVFRSCRRVKVRRERKEIPLIVYISFLAFPLSAKHREFLATVKPVPYCRKSTPIISCSYSSKSNIPCSHLRINFCCSRGLGLGAEEHTIIGINWESLFSE